MILAQPTVLRRLEVRQVAGTGKGGGGSLSNEELESVILPPGAPPLLRPGTIVHTDSAKAYRNLGFYDHLGTGPPDADVVEELMGQRPSQWRWESNFERQERFEAEKRDALGGGGRTAFWASKYRHLRLGHTAVVHKKTEKRGRQFVVMRRVKLAPEDAAVLAAAGDDRFLRGLYTWRLGGTQTVDGYWRTLRRRVAHRGINTAKLHIIHHAVLCHQWSHWAGPSCSLFEHLGATLKRARERDAADIAAADLNPNFDSESEEPGPDASRLQRSLNRGRVKMQAQVSTARASARRLTKARNARSKCAPRVRSPSVGPEPGAAEPEAVPDAPQVGPSPAEVDVLIAAAPATPVPAPGTPEARAAPAFLAGAHQRRRLRSLGEIENSSARRHFHNTKAFYNSMAQRRAEQLLLLQPGTPAHSEALKMHQERLVVETARLRDLAQHLE